ncbi:MAG: serine/threonine protein kinase, partial [Proteobacteria bacterium]
MTNPTRPAGLSPASAPDAGALVPGALVAERYRIERTLGEGGMGVVYLAEHVAMRKTVALKVLHAEGSRNTEIVQRFEREAV